MRWATLYYKLHDCACGSELCVLPDVTMAVRCEECEDGVSAPLVIPDAGGGSRYSSWHYGAWQRLSCHHEATQGDIRRCQKAQHKYIDASHELDLRRQALAANGSGAPVPLASQWQQLLEEATGLLAEASSRLCGTHHIIFRTTSMLYELLEAYINYLYADKRLEEAAESLLAKWFFRWQVLLAENGQCSVHC